MYLEEIKQEKDRLLAPFKAQIEAMTPLSKEERETVYAAAYGLYEVGDYRKAAGLFTHLLFHNPFDPRFWKGLASAEQMGKRYQEALHAWAVLSLLQPHQADAHFHAAECLLSCNDPKEAQKALKLALAHCPEKEKGLLAKIETITTRMKTDGR